MSIVTDERLMAYADGALPPEEARALEIMIEEDPALAARLRPFAMTGAPLAEVFETIAAEPLPDRLVGIIAASSAKTPAPQARRADAAKPSSGFASWLTNALGLEGSGLSFANAFAVAGLVVAGGIAGWTVAANTGTQDAATAALITGKGGEIIAAGALASALETQTSSDSAGASGIVTRASFRSKSAEGSLSICREYRVAGGTGQFGGIACRTNGGAWRIAAHTQLASAGAKKQGYETASGAANPVLEAATDALITGDILTTEEESALRTRGWK